MRPPATRVPWPPRHRSTAVACAAGVFLATALACALPSQAAAESPPVFIQAWGSQGSGDGQFNQPSRIAVDQDGNVYVTDTGNNRVQKFDSVGTFLAKWGFYGSGNGQFKFPCGIAVDQGGNIYISDADNNRIQKFDSNGAFLGKWGAPGTGPGQFYTPEGVAVGFQGFVYVVDQGTSRARVQKFDANGGFVSSWNIYARYPYRRAYDIAIGFGDMLYVVESFEGIAGDYSDYIEVFNNNGGHAFSWGDAVTFSDPHGLGTDPKGHVYVANGGDVVKFDFQGSFLTQWGTYGSGDGQFRDCTDVAIGPNGHIYVVEGVGDRIQEFGSASVPTLPTTWGRVKATYR